MLTPKVILPFLALIATVYADCQINGKTHKTGETDAEGAIVFECIEGGRKPIECIKNNNHIKPGDKWKSDFKPKGGFVYECVDNGKLSMSLNIIACIAPDGKEFQVDETAEVAGTKYKCERKSEHELVMTGDKGCPANGTVVEPNQYDTVGNIKKICMLKGGNYSWEAYACVLPDKQEIRVGTYAAMINKDFYKCTADLIDTSKAVEEKIAVISCGSHNDKQRVLLDEWREGKVNKRCLYNMTTSSIVTTITKCFMDDDTEIDVGQTLIYKDGQFYYCNSETGIVKLDEHSRHCILPNGTSLDVTKTKDIDNVRYLCLYNGSHANYHIEGCIWNGGEFISFGNHSKLAKGVAYRCTSVEGKFQVIKMTDEEYKIAFDLEQSKISGHGDEGIGHTAAPTVAPTVEPTTPKEEPSTQKEEPSTPIEEPSTQKEEPSTHKEEPSTHKEEQSTQKEEPSTQKEEPSTQKEEPSTQKEESSTQKEEPSTQKEEPSTQKEEPSTQKEEPSTHTPHTMQETATTEEEKIVTKLPKPTIELNVDPSTVQPDHKDPCIDFHPKCEKFGHICNPEKFQKQHERHSHFNRGSHGSDESCDWSREAESNEEHCNECEKNLKHLKRAHIKLIKEICPLTCGCCEHRMIMNRGAIHRFLGETIQG